MTIHDLFSKRQKRLRGQEPDVYTYDELPKSLRVQITYIWMDVLGNEIDYYTNQNGTQKAYKLIIDTICREYGILKLPNTDFVRNEMYLDQLVAYFLQEETLEKQLDVIELSFKFIDRLTRNYQYLRRQDADKHADNALTELNIRFKEHGVGFQFIENEIIKIDSELLHREAVKPALRLLNESNYRGAQQEFLSAYEHYRHGKNKEALNDCLKAFESTMKAICDKHDWQYQSNAAAKALITVCFENKLIPLFWQQQFNSLRSMLESSIPTGRNKLSGHGQGTMPTEVPEYLVAYMLHMTASTLVFLTTAEKSLN